MSAAATPADVLGGRASYALHHGECLAWMDTLPDASVDAVVCDPPYAEIDRDYGRMSEAEWEAFAHALVRKILRVLKPRGSAVFIIQPNSERVGRMRAWVFRFLAWCSDDLVRETNERIGMVQDAWWWNTAAIPTVHTRREHGLLRQSVKPCVWIGPDDCYRDQTSVFWSESDASASASRESRAVIKYPSGQSVRRQMMTSVVDERGGVTPFNLIPVANTNSGDSAGASGHGAGTPYDLAAWWVRYICPKGGVVADPCGGTFTMGLAAVRQGRRFLGCEKMASHFAAGVERMASCDMDALSPVRVEAPQWGDLFAAVGS